MYNCMYVNVWLYVIDRSINPIQSKTINQPNPNQSINQSINQTNEINPTQSNPIHTQPTNQPTNQPTPTNTHTHTTHTHTHTNTHTPHQHTHTHTTHTHTQTHQHTPTHTRGSTHLSIVPHQLSSRCDEIRSALQRERGTHCGLRHSGWWWRWSWAHCIHRSRSPHFPSSSSCSVHFSCALLEACREAIDMKVKEKKVK